MRMLRLAPLGLVLAAAAPLRAQGFAAGVSAASVQLYEGTSASRFTGPGFGVSASWSRGRLRIRGDIMRARLTPGDTGRSAITVVQFDGLVSYQIRPALEAEVGLGRRTVSPEFATQDVGVVRLGIRSEGRLGRLAGVWARGALLPVVRFNGGGSSHTAIEVGFGTWISLARDRARAELDYTLQRVDRTVRGTALPLQSATTRVGVMLAL
jgi:hypothetical protein